jgi:hypothetical protein
VEASNITCHSLEMRRRLWHGVMEEILESERVEAGVLSPVTRSVVRT